MKYLSSFSCFLLATVLVSSLFVSGNLLAQHSSEQGAKEIDPFAANAARRTPSFRRNPAGTKVSGRTTTGDSGSTQGREMAAPTRTMNRGRLRFGSPAGTRVGPVGAGGGASEASGREMVAPTRSFNRRTGFNRSNHFVKLPTGPPATPTNRRANSYRIPRVGGGSAGVD